METLLSYLPAIACGAMMLLVCVPMMKMMHKEDSESADAEPQQKIAELREEVRRLKLQSSVDVPTKERI